jgi:hypothetical protein
MNKVRLPLEFERWKHAITIPPDFPCIETMRYSVEAWKTARSFYLSIAEAVRWERSFRRRAFGLENGKGRSLPSSPEDLIGKEFLAETLADQYRGADKSLAQHQQLPAEFRIIHPGDNARRILQLIGYQVKNHCRDGLRSRQSMFLPAYRYIEAA